MKIMYRISSNSYKKDKLDWSKEQYFLNFWIYVFERGLWLDDELIIFANNVDDDLKEFLTFIENQKFPNVKLIYSINNNAQSFKQVFDYSLKYFKNEDEVIYFLEDDYIHSKYVKPILNLALKSGQEVADYISFYDHPDKYVPSSEGGNPFIGEERGEKTIVKYAANTHWKLTNSTTMTFATKLKTLIEDKDIFLSYLGPNVSHPEDFNLFLDLAANNGRTIATPIPGLSTHGETNYLSPGFSHKKFKINYNKDLLNSNLLGKHIDEWILSR